MSEEESKPRIAEATFVSANSGNLGEGKSPLAKLIEQAMSDAVLKAYADGITDPEEQRALMLAARTEAKAKYKAAVEKALAEGNLTG